MTGGQATEILKMAVQTEIEKICMIEAVIVHVNLKSVGPLNFLGKERIPFLVTNEHYLLTVFKKKFPEFAGLKGEAEKCGLGPGGYLTKFYTGRLRPEVQTLILLYTIFERKGTPFVYLSQKLLPLSYTYGASFTKLFI